MILNENQFNKIRWLARVLALAVLIFVLPFYFGYGNPLPFINPKYTLLDNLSLTVFPLIFIGLALGWKYEKIGGYLVTVPIALRLLLGLIIETELIIQLFIPLIIGILYLLIGYAKVKSYDQT